MTKRRSITAEQADKLLEGLEEIRKAFIRDSPYVSGIAHNGALEGASEGALEGLEREGSER